MEISLKYYTADGYKYINSHLVGKYNPNAIAHIKHIEMAMEKFQLDDDIIVYRGANAKFYQGYTKGDIFDGEIFYSTTLDKGFAQGFYNDVMSYGEIPVMLEIKVPKGTKCIYIGSNTSYDDEQELLLSNTLKYKVLESIGEKVVLEVVN